MTQEGRWVPEVQRQRRRQLAHFTAFCGGRPAATIGPDLLRSYRASLTHLALGTQRTYWVTVRGFTAWATIQGAMRRDPALGIPAPKVPRSVHRNLAPPDAAALIAVADERGRCIIVVGLQLGLRRAELSRLELGDIDRVQAVVTVHGKGGHVRRVPLTAEAAEAIDVYLAAEPASQGPLIRSRRDPSAALTPGGLGVVVAEIARRAGVKRHGRDGVGTHSLRHTAATDVYRLSGDVMVVRDMLGHVSLATTQTYVRGLDLEPLRAAIEGRRYAA